ncbi:helix-turn-helix domain-containing protein [Rhodococcus xishaensis]|uniref:ArsR family transcriptional regulator n=1 Tax=Rhodococcus xishaensis TaxID=2487364 RepID=A0A3S3A8L4_9NOCA|nr:helix-turn-helix domain-containing protein [Rhodococcus xishaensis]RVW02098.1 ArsR family transcriptional regulator [Rhodococcus xishaensis]
MSVSADLLLHPIRLRIVQALLGGRQLTTAALAAELPDVTSATLYRQVATLTDARVLDVVAMEKVRGAVRRTYALRSEAGRISPEELATMSPDEHRQAFMAFLAGLLSPFDAYLSRHDRDFTQDGVGYTQTALSLSDSEFEQFLDELRGVIERWGELGPAEGRTRRLFSTIVMPTE